MHAQSRQEAEKKSQQERQAKKEENMRKKRKGGEGGGKANKEGEYKDKDGGHTAKVRHHGCMHIFFLKKYFIIIFFSGFNFFFFFLKFKIYLFLFFAVGGACMNLCVYIFCVSVLVFSSSFLKSVSMNK